MADTLPHNLEAEQSLLGGLLFDNSIYEAVSDLKPEHFFDPMHGAIYGQIAELIDRRRLADGVTLKGLMEARSEDDFDAGAYLADLLDKASPGPLAIEYARLIREYAIKRDIYREAEKASVAALDMESTADPLDLIEETETAFARLRPRESARAILPHNLGARRTVELVEQWTKGAAPGIATGFRDMDRRSGGLHPSDLVILAGRPSMGKTSMCVNICHNVAARGGRVGFFSTEMSREQVDMRSLSRVLYRQMGDRAPSHRDMRAGQLGATPIAMLRTAADSLPHTLLIDDAGGLTVAQIRARTREMRRRLGGLDLIAIDYLQILGGKGRAENRVQEVSAMTKDLKTLAKDEGIAILLLSQLNRVVESRTPPLPQLSDLRDSGSIEQDADAVWFVYREAYYEERSEPQVNTPEWREWKMRMIDCQHKLQVIVGKDRHGPIGSETLFCDLAHDFIADLSWRDAA